MRLYSFPASNKVADGFQLQSHSVRFLTIHVRCAVSSYLTALTLYCTGICSSTRRVHALLIYLSHSKYYERPSSYFSPLRVTCFKKPRLGKTHVTKSRSNMISPMYECPSFYRSKQGHGEHIKPSDLFSQIFSILFLQYIAPLCSLPRSYLSHSFTTSIFAVHSVTVHNIVMHTKSFILAFAAAALSTTVMAEAPRMFKRVPQSSTSQAFDATVGDSRTGETCEAALGKGYLLCKATGLESGDLCYNPDLGDKCCANECMCRILISSELNGR